MVGEKRVELLWVTPYAPKAYASASSAIRPHKLFSFIYYCFHLSNANNYEYIE